MTHTGDMKDCPTCGPLYAEARAAFNDQQVQMLHTRTSDPVRGRTAERYGRAHRMLQQSLAEHQGTP